MPVFLCTIGRSAGEVHLTGTSLDITGSRGTETRRSVAWSDVLGIAVHRKGPLGPVGVVQVRLRDGGLLALEVSDGPRFADSVANVAVPVERHGWA